MTPELRREDGTRLYASAEPLRKGWSADRKLRAVTAEGRACLLRLSDAPLYDAKKREFEIVRKFASLGFPMSRPLDFGWTMGRSQVYMLLSWVEGEDLERALPGLPEGEQYRLGREAGGILRRIHSLPLEPGEAPAVTKQGKKLEQLARYEASDVRIDGDEAAACFVREHIGAIWREKPAYLHGDFHPGNLILTPGGALGVIDFNRWEIGDPYEEFYKLQSFARELSVPYCVGQIDAYFQDSVPSGFWEALAVYAAHASLYSILWAKRFGQEEIDGMVRRARTAMEDYDGFASTVPKWYRNAPRG